MLTNEELQDHIKALSIIFPSWELADLINDGCNTLRKIWDKLDTDIYDQRHYQKSLYLIEYEDIIERLEYLVLNNYIIASESCDIDFDKPKFSIPEKTKDKLKKTKYYVIKYPILNKSIIEYFKETGLIPFEKITNKIK